MKQTIEEIQAEVKLNHEYIKSKLAGNCSSDLIYVNGSLYKDWDIINVYKGCGWHNGRICEIQLKDFFPEDADVNFVSLSFGRLRKFRKIKNSQYRWEMIELEEDK